MKKRYVLIVAICLLAVLAVGAVGAAGGQQEQEGDAYALYFLERDLAAADGGDALRTEERILADSSGRTSEELARLLMGELLKGPADPTLKSPLPQGTALLSLQQEGTEVHVDLSAVYGTLSGVELSLADYAITLTLTQLPDVVRTRITVQGSDLDYRSRQRFLTRDVLFAPKEDVVGTVDAALWFLGEDDVLTAEERTLTLYEGDTQVGAVVRALENGPETKGLRAVLPEGFKVRKVWLEEGVCYLSLSSMLLEETVGADALTLAVQALEQSLLSLDTVGEVCFLVDGELADTYGPIQLPQHSTANP